MTFSWRVGTATIGSLGVLAVVEAAGLWVVPAMAQSAGVSRPDVSVDLDVLNSLDRGPGAPDGAVALRPPHQPEAVASPPEPGPAPSRTPARRRARPVARRHTATRSAAAPAGDDAGRRTRGRALGEPHRTREEAARLERVEAERLRQAKAEIEAAAHSAPPPQKMATTAGRIPSPGPGPVPPPAPKRRNPEGAPRAVAALTTRPSATSPPRAAAGHERAALIKSESPAPHIEFAAGAADLTPAARSALDAVAKALAGDEGKRVQLVAYATGAADEANQARRISLSRALNVRAYLIDHGVRNTRMDVRALGNRPDGSKPADRVEILFLDK